MLDSDDGVKIAMILSPVLAPHAKRMEVGPTTSGFFEVDSNNSSGIHK